MSRSSNSMKGNISALLDKCASDIDDLSLAISVNSFLVTPVSFEEAFAIYGVLLTLGEKEKGGIPEPLYSGLLNEVRNVPPATVAEKMRNYSISIRKIVADSMASSLCRQHDTLLEYLRGAVQSNSTDELLALADGALIVVPKINSNIVPMPCPRRA